MRATGTFPLVCILAAAATHSTTLGINSGVSPAHLLQRFHRHLPSALLDSEGSPKSRSYLWPQNPPDIENNRASSSHRGLPHGSAFYRFLQNVLSLDEYKKGKSGFRPTEENKGRSPDPSFDDYFIRRNKIPPVKLDKYAANMEEMPGELNEDSVRNFYKFQEFDYGDSFPRHWEYGENRDSRRGDDTTAQFRPEFSLGNHSGQELGSGSQSGLPKSEPESQNCLLRLLLNLTATEPGYASQSSETDAVLKELDNEAHLAEAGDVQTLIPKGLSHFFEGSDSLAGFKTHTHDFYLEAYGRASGVGAYPHVINCLPTEAECSVTLQSGSLLQNLDQNKGISSMLGRGKTRMEKFTQEARSTSHYTQPYEEGTHDEESAVQGDAELSLPTVETPVASHQRGIRDVSSVFHEENCHSFNLLKCGKEIFEHYKSTFSYAEKCRMRKEFLDCMEAQRELTCPVNGKQISVSETTLMRDKLKALFSAARGCILEYAI